MKISVAIEGYWLDKKLEFSDRTVGNYSLFFGYFVGFTNDAEIEKITTRDVRAFLIYLKEQKKHSKRTIHDGWVALSSLWTWAEKEIEIAHIIRGKIPIPGFPEKKIDPFTKEEIKRLVDAARFSREWKSRKGKRVRSRRPTGDRDVAIILTLLDSGARNTELRRFNVKDYDSATGRLFIAHGKGDKQRFVVLGNRAKKSLWRYLASRPDAKSDEPLFITATGERLLRDNLHHMLRRMGEQAGVLPANPHRFRHTMAINFLRNGGNVFVLKELLGHSSLTMVMRYARIAEIDIDGAARFSIADNWKI
ncbi:MAG: tyrosine-type recombinase/integrase [Caldilineaceae bacterium]